MQIKRTNKTKTVITGFFLFILVLSLTGSKITIIISENELNNVFMEILEPTSKVVSVNLKNINQSISNINKVLSSLSDTSDKSVIVDYVEYSKNTISLIHILQALNFRVIDIGLYFNYWVVCSISVLILALISRYLLFSGRIKKEIPYLALLPTVLVPSEYFLIVFTSIISILLLGVESKLCSRKWKIKFSKNIDYQDVLLTIILVILFGIFAFRVSNYVQLFLGIVFGLILVLIIKIFAWEKFYMTISFVGVIAGITIMILKLWVIHFPYGTDIPLKFLLAVISAKLAKEDSIFSFLNSFLIAAIISL